MVTKEIEYHSFLGCNGGWKGDCLWVVHKCLVIATLENHDNPIEKSPKVFDPFHVFRSKSILPKLILE